MMACRRILQTRSLLRMSRVAAAYSTKMAQMAEEMVHYDKRLPKRIDLQPARKPFAKSLVLGEFDTELLCFPEAQDTERNIAFFKWLKPVEEYVRTVDPKPIDKNCDIPEDVLATLRELGVFAAYLPEHYGGLGLLESEYLKLLETLAHIPALALLLSKVNRCVDMIVHHGSEEHKMHYLPKISNGSILPTYCLSEPKTSDNSLQVRSLAILSQDLEQMTLTGQKIFVPYLHKANLLLVFALCASTDDEIGLERTLSVLLVPKDDVLPSLDISDPIPTVGVRGLPHFNVLFQGTQIPHSHVLGEIGLGTQMYSEFFTRRKQDSGAIAIGLLRDFVDLLTDYVTNTKHLNRQLYEFDSAKEVLGSASHALYAMESVTYFTAALADLYKDQDVSIEGSIVQTFCASECARQVSQGIHLVGTPAFLADSPWDRLFRDAHALTVFENSVIDNETFVALLALQHAGLEMREKIKRLRNPFDFPWWNFMHKEKRLKLDLHEFLHPSLEEPARKLEVMLYTLKLETVSIMARHGALVAENHMDLRRYYEVVTLAYVFTSVLARASRAYCIGLRYGEREIQMAHTLAFRMVDRINALGEQLDKGEFANGDHNFKEITSTTMANRKYIASHPLTRNY